MDIFSLHKIFIIMNSLWYNQNIYWLNWNISLHNLNYLAKKRKKYPKIFGGSKNNL